MDAEELTCGRACDRGCVDGGDYRVYGFMMGDGWESVYGTRGLMRVWACGGGQGQIVYEWIGCGWGLHVNMGFR